MTITAEARVVASFTLVASLLLGSWAGVENLLRTTNLLPASDGLEGFVLLLIPLVATGVAVQATRATEAAWARALGGAAAVLGTLCTLAGVLYLAR